MSSTLDQLLEDGVIDEVLGCLKTGKEAEVWLVRHHDDVLAAKVYKDRATRSFKNSSGYKEGRAVRNSRTQRAMDKGSKFGQAASEDEWKSAESDALHKLHREGVRVPTPVLFYEGILLMELVLDENGDPAPRLIDAHIPPESAEELYADLRAQAVRMLCCDLIHGDLSAYNVLLAARGPTIIDFPQVVGASHNTQAEQFFTRDIENLRSFFGAADPKLLERKSDASEIWRTYVRRELTPDYVPTGRVAERIAAPRREQERKRNAAPKPLHRQEHAAPQKPAPAAPLATQAPGQHDGHRPPRHERGPQQGQRPAKGQHSGQRPPPPAQPGQRPAQQGQRPPHAPRPPQQGQRPPQQGQRPPQQGQRPPQQGQRPQQQGQRPPQQGQRPPQQGQRPQHQQRPPQRPGRPPAPLVERIARPALGTARPAPAQDEPRETPPQVPDAQKPQGSTR